MYDFEELEEILDEAGPILSTTDLVDILDVPESRVRRWARAANVKRTGASFAFDVDTALEMARDFADAEEVEEDAVEDDEEDEDEEDEIFTDEDEEVA